MARSFYSLTRARVNGVRVCMCVCSAVDYEANHRNEALEQLFASGGENLSVEAITEVMVQHVQLPHPLC